MSSKLEKQFFAQKYNKGKGEEEKKEITLPPEKQKEAIQYAQELKAIKSKDFFTKEDEERVDELIKKIEKIFTPEEDYPIKMEIIKNTEVKVGGWVYSSSISPDGKFAIIGSGDDHTARLAKIERNEKGDIIKMEIIKNTEVKVGGAVWSSSISPDGKFAIIGSSDRKAILAKIEKE